MPLLASASPIFGVDTIHNEAAPLLSSSESKTISDSYIIVFKKEVSHATIDEHHKWVQMQHVEVESAKRDLQKRSQIPISVFGGLRHTFNIAGSILGYSGHFDEDVIERVRYHPDVGNRIYHRLSLICTRDIFCSCRFPISHHWLRIVKQNMN